jgi:hypothetical protein
MKKNQLNELFPKIRRVNKLVSSEINEPPVYPIRDFEGNFTPVIDAATLFPHLAKSLAGYTEILDDLRRGIASLKRIHLLGTEDDVILEALFSHAVINYGRCFTQADRRKLTLAKRSPWILSGTKEEATHDQIMHLRHQLVAHAGTTPFRDTKVCLMVDSQENPTKFKGISNLGRSLATTDFGTTLRLAAHFEKLASRVQSKVDELCGRITENAKKEWNLKPSDPKDPGENED